MAVEIRELAIKALVVKEGKNEHRPIQKSSGGVDSEKIIQECVNQVLKIISKDKNR